MDRLDDLQVYQRLTALVEELRTMSKNCHSVAAGTACEAASVALKTVASGVYHAGLKQGLADPQNMTDFREKV